ncbi:Holliday junction resolvase RecU [Lentilactobacillus otakiensis]|uniref:Holliday junction resolvase RecU n=1 Tax=Lentilactobacillus otakiensis DSM 19908 = JCM 15040 TaxID=1423780 RepID=S4NIH9_9LACO|nr:Holliday junction resolvase RecU [Lentilactobacillus otakiensis]KRL09187.1 Holliday junction resolvase recU [Lentilactobacillus otakiensis DSM 19908 = JCM 15040]MBZ3775804.1 Holliday junction resolvase RecU [Lentilactobacillus otakiensis]MDV3519023.1 Holliday junction resolvase RecU [Lentilactobacillus otakiensis]GAD15811.1 Holliday junction resolvase [Lentilactobacillus otakiensis DSM 19908 = JCM 15040]
MTIRYPNGNQFRGQPVSSGTSNDSIDFSNRGMTLEDEINKSNQYYLREGIAVIHKKPTPIQIVSVDYPKRSAARIKEAYFRRASTTDYNGVYHGKYIDFDAKETKNKTSFPLKNFHEHQVEHMRQCLDQQGICFAIIKFVSDQSVYVLKATDLIAYWDDQNKGGRKSIPRKVIEQEGFLIQYRINPLLPYLKAVDSFIE